MKRARSAAAAAEASDDDDEDGGGGGAPCGIIESVDLENFMCHKKFHIDLGPRVTFIIGENGAGKSAVLVGILAALGGKAAFSQRGSSMRDLIRQGAPFAVAAVRFRNRGREAFRHDVYGNSVSVERRWTREGGGSYKVRDWRGRTRDDKRATVQALLDHFNIQIENPCVVLMQDMAKQFLASQSPSVKYNFFLRATLLDRIVADYADAAKKLGESRMLLEQKERLLPGLHQAVDELTHEHDMLARFEEMARRAEDAKRDLAWAWVVAKRAELAAAEDSRSSALGRRERAEAAAAEAERKATELDEEIHSLSETLEEATTAAEAATAQRAEADRKLAALKRTAAERRARVTDLEKRAAQKRKQLGVIRSSIEEAKHRDDEALTQERSERAHAVEVARSRQREAEAEFSKANAVVKEHEAETEKINAEATDYTREVTIRRQRVEKCSATVRSCEHQKSDRIRALGDIMPQVVRAIESAKASGRFRRPEALLGPIGTQIELVDPRWAVAIEAILRRDNLAAYIVGCTEDLHTFKRVCADARVMMPHVFVVAPKDHVLNTPDAPHGVLTVMRALRCSNPNVSNVLIDHFRAHLIGLAETRQVADQLLQQGRGVIEAYTAGGDRDIMRNGSLAFYSSNQKEPFWFGADHDRRIEIARKEHDEARRALHEIEVQGAPLEQRRREAVKELQAAQRQRDQASRANTTARGKLIQAENAAREAQRAEEMERPDVSEMEAQALRMEEEIGRIMADRDAAKETADSINGELGELKAHMDEADAALRAANDRVADAQEKLSKPMLVRKRLASRAADAEREKERMGGELRSAENAVKRLQAEVTAVAAKARRVCEEERHPDKRPEELGREIEAMEREVERSREGTRPLAEVEAELRDARERLDTANRDVDSARGLSEGLEMSLQERERRVEEIRAHISRRTRMLFGYALRRRRCYGDLIIDHDNRKLDVLIKFGNDMAAAAGASQEGAAHAAAAAATNTKTLSGGERSYSTIALLIALWEAVECPFCALDEFDVYMDSVNRIASVRSLLEFAQLYSHRQFIVITPQNDLPIETTDLVVIKKLKPPVRSGPIDRFALPFHSQSAPAAPHIEVDEDDD